MKSCVEASDLPACDVLAFGPHPDDIEIACGGTLLLLHKQGKTTALVDCTRGEKGSRGKVRDRDAEALAAGKPWRLRATIHNQGYQQDPEHTAHNHEGMSSVFILASTHC